MRVRHMSADELDAVADFLCSDDVLSLVLPAREAPVPSTPEALGAELARPHSESFVALGESGAIVGQAHARVLRGVLWLDRLAVADDDAAEDRAAALLRAVVVNYIGDAAISVRIAASDEDAKLFHQDQGFVATDETGENGTLVLRRLISRA